MNEKTTFREELEQLINRHSQENRSNTPDFILADYMNDCLHAFERASVERERWYGTRLSIEFPDGEKVKP